MTHQYQNSGPPPPPPPYQPASATVYTTHQEYGQNQQIYGQQQFYGQEQYGQAGGPTVIVAKQSQYDFTMYQNKCPAVFMILLAVANIGEFVGTAVVNGWQYYPHFMVAFAFYLILGIVACVGSFSRQGTAAPAIVTIVAGFAAIIMAIVQMALNGQGITLSIWLMTVGNSATSELALGISVGCLVVSILAFVFALVILIIASKVVCCKGSVTPIRA